MITRYALTTVAILCLSSYRTQAATIYTDTVVDSGGDWTLGAGASFWNSASANQYFTTPGSGSGVLAGNQSVIMGFTNYALLTGATTGLTLQPGTYTITGQIGNPNNVPFPTTTRFKLFPGTPPGSFAGVNALDSYVISSSTPTPALGFWETWSRTYFVPATEPTIGQNLNFIVQDLQSGTNMTFDGTFTIDFVPIPEPAAVMSMLLGAAGLALLCASRRWRSSRVGS